MGRGALQFQSSVLWTVWFHRGKSWFIKENPILTKMGWLGGSLILGNLHVLWCVLNMKRCARISSSSPEKKSVVLDKSNPLLAARSNAWAVHYVHCLQGRHPSDWDHLWSSMGIPPTPEVTSPKNGWFWGWTREGFAGRGCRLSWGSHWVAWAENCGGEEIAVRWGVH